MDKKFYKLCIENDIYQHYLKGKDEKLSLFRKVWLKYFSAYNAVYLIRKMKYLYASGGGGVNKLRSKLIGVKLLRRYSISFNPDAEIDLGLYIPHPIAIVISECKIGKNFAIHQGCTIGQKFKKGVKSDWCVPTIGDDVRMFAGSMIIGDIEVADGVKLGAASVLMNDALVSGVYVGCPAKLKEKI